MRSRMHIEATRTFQRDTRNAIANAFRGPPRSKLARMILARTRNALASRCIVSVGRYCSCNRFIGFTSLDVVCKTGCLNLLILPQPVFINAPPPPTPPGPLSSRSYLSLWSDRFLVESNESPCYVTLDSKS